MKYIVWINDQFEPNNTLREMKLSKVEMVQYWEKILVRNYSKIMLQPNHLQIQTHHKKNSDSFLMSKDCYKLTQKPTEKLNKKTLWNT
jgi:hypothetical protein